MEEGQEIRFGERGNVGDILINYGLSVFYVPDWKRV